MNKQEIEKSIRLLKVEKENTTFKTDERRPLYDIAISALTQQLNNGWISVTEQLPEKPKENSLLDGKPLELYLVSIEYDEYPFRAFWNGKSFTDGCDKLPVTAWQPLPEPYKEVSE